MSVSGWTPFARSYEPLRIGSIDGTDIAAHDHGIIRALNTKYRPNKGVDGDPEKTLFVGRLNPLTSKVGLEKAFEKYGDLRHVHLVRDLVTGMSKCYGFVEYKREEGAMRAHRDAHGMVLDSAEVLVEMEAERVMPGWRPRRLGGGFGGKKEAGQLRFGGRVRPFSKPINLQMGAPAWREGALMMGRDDGSRDDARDRSRHESRGSKFLAPAAEATHFERRASVNRSSEQYRDEKHSRSRSGSRRRSPSRHNSRRRDGRETNNEALCGESRRDR